MAKLSAKEIIDSLKEMTLLEIKEVVDLMKEEFGVDPSAVAVAAAPAAEAASEGPSAVDYTANRHTPSTPEVPAGYRHVNWLALSIIVTVVGFFTTCVVGGIVGIIAIVNANKANSLHESGQYAEAQKASTTAKSCVIIGWVIAAMSFMAIGCTQVFDELYNVAYSYGI